MYNLTLDKRTDYRFINLANDYPLEGTALREGVNGYVLGGDDRPFIIEAYEERSYLSSNTLSIPTNETAQRQTITTNIIKGFYIASIYLGLYGNSNPNSGSGRLFTAAPVLTLPTRLPQYNLTWEYLYNVGLASQLPIFKGSLTKAQLDATTWTGSPLSANIRTLYEELPQLKYIGYNASYFASEKESFLIIKRYGNRYEWYALRWAGDQEGDWVYAEDEEYNDDETIRITHGDKPFGIIQNSFIDDPNPDLELGRDGNGLKYDYTANCSKECYAYVKTHEGLIKPGSGTKISETLKTTPVNADLILNIGAFHSDEAPINIISGTAYFIGRYTYSYSYSNWDGTSKNSTPYYRVPFMVPVKLNGTIINTSSGAYTRLKFNESLNQIFAKAAQIFGDPLITGMSVLSKIPDIAAESTFDIDEGITGPRFAYNLRSERQIITIVSSKILVEPEFHARIL